MMQSQQIPMTFQRYETKYMLSPIMARKLRKSLPGHLQMDEYGLDTICSLYYDCLLYTSRHEQRKSYL